MGEEGRHSLGSLDSQEVVGGGRSRGGGEGGHWPLGVNGGGGGGPRLGGVLCGGKEGSKGGQNHLPCLSMLAFPAPALGIWLGEEKNMERI